MQQRHLLLLFSLSCLISSLSALHQHALLLNAEPFAPKSSKFCLANQNKSCSSGKVNISFPFFPLDECHDTASSFGIANCESRGAKPEWPSFTKSATKADNGLNSTVTDLSIPDLSTAAEESGSANRTFDPRFDPGYGYINLTWSAHQSKNVCDSLVSSEQISNYIPQSIDLQSFEHSAFKFDRSNIILLFRCNPALAVETSSFLNMSSTACVNYETVCKQSKDPSYNCYQYLMSTSKKLELPRLVNSSGCKQVMFFVAMNSSLSASDWEPGLMRLNWSVIGTDQLASVFQTCAGCSFTNGSCGYDNLGNFQCFCDNRHTSTNCSENMPNDVAVSPTPLAAASQSGLIAPTPSPGCKNGLLCNIIAIGVSVTLVTTMLILLVPCWLLKTKTYTPPNLHVFDVSETPQLSTSKNRTRNLALENLTERPIEMSYSSIVSATSSFINFLGEGGYGVVYRGSLTDIQIAVKVVAVTSEQTKKHFLNEVTTIGRIHHVHVVRLLGFCIEDPHRILVYEYVNNGSLDQWLFKHRGDPLNWKQRYGIAVGIAKGLGYLHEECRHQIVHCDIKPQNILLDEHMFPKIADFGLAKLICKDESHVATLVRGTPGYMAPEFWMGGEGQLSTKIDVYSFGMVLLELISGHRNFENGACFPEEAFEAAMKGDIQSLVDVELSIVMPPQDECTMVLNTMEPWQHIRRAVFVALWCIQDHPMRRPHMSEVVMYLEGKMAVSEQPPRPTIASILLSLSQHESYQSTHHHHEITPISGR